VALLVVYVMLPPVMPAHSVPLSMIQVIGAAAVATAAIETLSRSGYVAKIQSAWTSPGPAGAALVSTDGKSGLIVTGVVGPENEQQARTKELTAALAGETDGVLVRAGGTAMVNLQVTEQSKRDLLLLEAIVIPLSFLVLIWVFGGVFAAALPIAVGVLAILGSLAVLRAVTFFTDVSIFALNLTTAMGLALAIDYTLLIVSRYRDELAGGASRVDAVATTMATAGRTVLFSAVTVALSMAVMVLFPMNFLRSFAYAGVATVSFAALAAVVVTPAAIMLLGDRLNALDVRRGLRKLLGRPEPQPVPITEQFWYRSTQFVMRRAVPVGLAGVALLVFLGAPFLGVKPGFPDDRVLPKSASAHQVGDLLRSDFKVDSDSEVPIIITDSVSLDRAELDRYKARLRAMRGLPAPLKALLERLPPSAHPMDVMRTGASALGTLLQRCGALCSATLPWRAARCGGSARSAGWWSSATT
jgi:RND superfamily putative drug exporter